jgi:LPS O-antigen subunit length determinant protein (WzzB/FepE family)
MENKTQDDSIDLFDILELMWVSKIKIFCITFLFALISILVIFLSPVKYTSSTLLAPIASKTAPAIGGNYANLASMAGINLGGAGDSKTNLAIEVLQSRSFFINFINKRDLAAVLFAASSWNSDTNSLIYNSKKYNIEASEWNSGEKPNIKKMHKYWIEDVISISQDAQTNFVTISIKHISPSIAFNVLEWVLEDLDDDLRSRDIASSSEAIEYLEGEVVKTESDDLRVLFYTLIQEQTNKKMIAITQPRYLFDLIDPPYKPEIKSEPKSLLILISFTILGFFISLLYIFIGSIVDNRQRSI